MFVGLLCFGLLTVTVSYFDVAENGHHMYSLTNEMFSSPQNLRKTIGDFVTEMVEVKNTNWLLGKKGDVKYDFLAETSSNYTIHLFGSRMVGLGLKNSDLDLYIDVGGCYNGQHPASQTFCPNAVQTIADSLNRHNHSFYDIQVIQKTRVPILKAVHRNTGLDIDISTTNGIAVEHSHLIRGYLADHRVRFVAAAVKIWARDQGIAKSVVGRGGFTSYCILSLTLFALMQDSPKIISPIADIKKKYTGPKLVIDGWDCGHCRSTHPKSNNNKTEVQLLYQFFNFYSKMTLEDLRDNVICPYTGSLIPKEQLLDTPNLPSEFDNYKHQVMVNRSYLMVCNTSLCIQDPVEQSNNIVKNVQDWVIVKFFKSCKTAAYMLQNIINQELDSLSSDRAHK